MWNLLILYFEEHILTFCFWKVYACASEIGEFCFIIILQLNQRCHSATAMGLYFNICPNIFRVDANTDADAGGKSISLLH